MTEASPGPSAATAEIRFYTLKDAGGTARLRHACALTEQAWLGGERVLVWLENPAAQSAFDDLLWTFGDRAFVPHEALTAGTTVPVALFSGDDPHAAGLADGFSTLLMLRDVAVDGAMRFARIIEVVDAEPACRNAGRNRFRFYRERGATPQHIEVTQ